MQLNTKKRIFQMCALIVGVLIYIGGMLIGLLFAWLVRDLVADGGELDLGLAMMPTAFGVGIAAYYFIRIQKAGLLESSKGLKIPKEEMKVIIEKVDALIGHGKQLEKGDWELIVLLEDLKKQKESLEREQEKPMTFLSV